MDIYRFYSNYGWKEKKSLSKDAELFEDLRKCAAKYVSKCRYRVNKHIPNKGHHLLDFASGPIQYKEYISYSKNFKFRHCVDFSKLAIDNAKKKIGKKGKFYCDDILKLKFKKNFFDCIISLHTIYHVPKNKQKKVILKLLNIAKKNKPIIIVYSNPNTFIDLIKKMIFFKRKKKKLYFHCFPNSWWYQFSRKADVKIYSWRSFASQHQKIIFPDNFIGKIMFYFLFKLENKFNSFFSKNFQYPMIVLKKK